MLVSSVKNRKDISCHYFEEILPNISHAGVSGPERKFCLYSVSGFLYLRKENLQTFFFLFEGIYVDESISIWYNMGGVWI